ncbi:hypothetical protein Ciccas_012590 [Cichlidogyrus casuarinus]|uniref:Uncharacterized protein n=1 Tax=Cichlidogyrus casuarinus TaxID=1844966 RepID=A0ABD2PPR7_9PLAT
MEEFKKKLKIAFEADDEEEIGNVLFSDNEGEIICYDRMGVHLIECYSLQICTIIKRVTNLETVDKIIETLVLGFAYEYKGDLEKLKMVYEALAAHGKSCHIEDSTQFHYFVIASLRLLKASYSNDPVCDAKLKELMNTICSKRFLINDESLLSDWLGHRLNITIEQLFGINFNITMRFLAYHLEFLVNYLPLEKLFFTKPDRLFVQSFNSTIVKYSKVDSRRSYYKLISQLNTRLYIDNEYISWENTLAQTPEIKFYMLRGEYESSEVFCDVGNLRSVTNHWIERLQSGFANFAQLLRPVGYRMEDVVEDHFRIMKQFDLYNEIFFEPLHALKLVHDSEPKPFEPHNGPCFRIPD